MGTNEWCASNLKSQGVTRIVDRFIPARAGNSRYVRLRACL